MTAACSSTTRRPANPGAVLFLLAAAAILLAARAALPQDHAVEQHGDEAEAIRRCLDQHGPYQVWRSKDRTTWYYLCHLADGRWGLQPMAWDDDLGQFVEKTAFVKGNGSWKALTDYLKNFATRWKGPLP